jgi:hypothetical protein
VDDVDADHLIEHAADMGEVGAGGAELLCDCSALA